ncbi:MAG TPA: amidohydrolase family protein [Minicystis sp.]|nr:amidohydrolase family protein [Minicystis sp.]
MIEPPLAEGRALGCTPASWAELASRMPMPAEADPEGARVAAGLPPVVDAHVHLFPDRVIEAIWRWFEQHAWGIRYPLHAPEALGFLFARGVARVVGLAYAHAPGMARVLNAYMAELARAEPRLIGLGTVLPGEDGALDVVEEAFRLGLRGLKLHCHVQRMSPDADELEAIYDACARAGRPVVIHAGREPAMPEYGVDVRALCSADRVERVLRDHPRLKLCVPHLGADEFDAYERLLGRYDNLWLDTTLAVGRLFGVPVPEPLLRARPDRLVYGTDFPNIPFAWDRELRFLADFGFRGDELASILGGAALALYGA